MLFMLAGLKKVQHFRSVITVTVESRVNEKLSEMMKSCEVTKLFSYHISVVLYAIRSVQIICTAISKTI